MLLGRRQQKAWRQIQQLPPWQRAQLAWRYAQPTRQLTNTGDMREAPPAAVLGKDFFRDIPYQEQNRPYFGRSLDLNRIQRAILSANRGYMRPMTDISLETISLDGHASSLLGKRLNRLAALPWEVEAADMGSSREQRRADEYADQVREQLKMIPNFRQKLIDIDWAIFHGRSGQELQWVFRWGAWCVSQVHWIHPRRLSYGPNRDLRVVDPVQERGNFRDDVGFPLDAVPYKFITYTPRRFGDYAEREGLAPRTLYWSFFQRFGVRDRMELLEIFGKPWRIVSPKSDPNHPPPSADDLDEAFRAVNGLGNSSTARLPTAMEVQVTQPGTNAGQVHAEAIDHAQKVMSKLYLGQTGTTDAVSTGLGSSIGDAMLSEEDLIIAADAWDVSEVVEDQLTDAIIAVNYGVNALPWAPHFRIRTDPPMNRTDEAELVTKAQAVGLDVAEQEVRERLGFRELREGEVGLQPPPAAGVPPGGGLGFSQDVQGVRELEDAPPPVNDVAPAPPPAVLDPVPAVDEAVEGLAAKMTDLGIDRCRHGHTDRCPRCGIESVSDVERGPDGDPVWTKAWRPIAAKAPAITPQLAASARPVQFAAEPERRASTLFGSPDDLVSRGVDALGKVTSTLAAELASAAGKAKTVEGAVRATNAAARRFSRRRLQDVLENEILMGALLGVLDADWEGQEDRPVEVEAFSDLWPDAILLRVEDEPFSRQPRQAALDAFRTRAPLSREVFDRLSEQARARAFTVSGDLLDGALEKVHKALARQIGEGAALRDFRKVVAEGLETAGWTPLNPSHLETVFRTNVLTAYNDGRFAQVTDPDVMALRPYTQTMTVDDSRVRDNHEPLHLKIFRTEDLTRRDLPPWGYNCRCRFRSLSQRQVGKRTISPVSLLRGLVPDPGFS